jgi:hypothetical protein
MKILNKSWSKDVILWRTPFPCGCVLIRRRPWLLRRALVSRAISKPASENSLLRRPRLRLSGGSRGPLSRSEISNCRGAGEFFLVFLIILLLIRRI